MHAEAEQALTELRARMQPKKPAASKGTVVDLSVEKVDELPNWCHEIFTQKFVSKELREFMETIPGRAHTVFSYQLTWCEGKCVDTIAQLVAIPHEHALMWKNYGAQTHRRVVLALEERGIKWPEYGAGRYKFHVVDGD